MKMMVRLSFRFREDFKAGDNDGSIRPDLEDLDQERSCNFRIRLLIRMKIEVLMRKL